MKISYAITVKDEIEEIKRLIPFLLKNKREHDEIVVLWDENGSKEVKLYLLSFPIETFVFLHERFHNHFAEWKNALSKECSGDFIFQIDADELPHLELIQNMPQLIEANPQVDVYLVPRENFVNGITENHIKQWGWKLDYQERINFPDYQWRIYRNTPEIKWINKVHERLDGFKHYGTLDPSTEWSLNHIKDIKRQEKQNNYYNTL